MKQRLRHLGFVDLFAITLAMLCLATTASAGAKFIVNPGDSIQAAVDAASPGDKIIVNPGTYVGEPGAIAAVRVNKSNIKLIAKSKLKNGVKVIVVPGPGNQHGIIAEPDPGQPDIEKYLIKGFTAEYGLTHLVYFEVHEDMLEAIKREKAVKNWRRIWKIELIENANPKWIDLFSHII